AVIDYRDRLRRTERAGRGFELCFSVKCHSAAQLSENCYYAAYLFERGFLGRQLERTANLLDAALDNLNFFVERFGQGKYDCIEASFQSTRELVDPSVAIIRS